MLVLKYVKRGGKICGNFESKKVSCANYNFAKIYDKIKEKFQTLSNFPKIFRVQYQDKDVETMIDLDCPMVNRSSIILIVTEETPDSDM